MGWRYRKRIKLLPGVHINISKSGISTNVGIKGANVTFTSKGTYVNTGIPGTGLYRRDRISSNKQQTSMYMGQSNIYSNPVVENTEDFNLYFTMDSDGTISVPAFSSMQYIAYIVALFMPIIGLALYCYVEWWMFFCCLFVDFVQLICLVCTEERTATIKTKPQYSIIDMELKKHHIRFGLSCTLVLLNFFPVFAMNSTILSFLFGLNFMCRPYEGGELVFFLTFVMVGLWIYKSCQEYSLAKSFKHVKGLRSVEAQDENAGDDVEEDVSKDNQPKSDTTDFVQQDEKASKEAELNVSATGTYLDMGEDYGNIDIPYDPKMDLEMYRYPTLSLIASGEDSAPSIDMVEQNANKDRITKVLRDFGVEISSIKATIGPTITLYEIVPAEGTRISKIRNLEDDIALSLAAEGIRIIAPIPGKGTIGIEVPNKKKCVVSMESILSSKVYQDSQMELPCAIGKTITNEVFMFDLAKAPHLLVAGVTGQGKSVGLNAIIASLLYKKHPAEIKFVMIDTKKVEFSISSPIENHFLAKIKEKNNSIVTDAYYAARTISSLCRLVDLRYEMIGRAGCRNIKEYNAKFRERKLNPKQGHEFMPYIVVIVDDYGDLIIKAGNEIEQSVCYIAQLARAVGIHMIIATQRPQASIISGAIKTNFPARMAFKVSSMIDSRIVLDCPGAQQLIGRGDMLFQLYGEPIRVQCALIDTQEVDNVTNFIAKQQSYLHPMFLPDVFAEGDGDLGVGSVDTQYLDPLFAEVAKFVVNTQQGSTSVIQRNYSIGYNRAGKIMDQLERMGVVGTQSGSTPREVLIKDPLTLESLLSTIGN